MYTCINYVLFNILISPTIITIMKYIYIYIELIDVVDIKPVCSIPAID